MIRRAWVSCAAGLAAWAGGAGAAPPSSTLPATELPLMPAPGAAAPAASKPLPEAAKLPYDHSREYLPDCPTCGLVGPGCQPCGPPGRVWVGAEVLGWSVRGMALPPLVTGGPPGSTRATAGVLGAPGTQVIYGDERINSDLRLGYRITAGAWLDDCQTIGVEASYFQLDDEGGTFTAGDPAGRTVVSRPFTNVSPAATGPDSELVSLPGVLGGTVSVSTASRLLGGDANLRHNLCCCGDPCTGYRVDLLYGYRFLNLHENVRVREALTNLDGSSGIPVGTTIDVLDNFHTSNQFHGGQVGVAGERRFGRLYVDAFGKIALGATFREIEQVGATRIGVPGAAPTTLPGGLLVQGTNQGRFSRDDFSVVPEVGVRLGYRLGDHVRVFGGYNFLYWTNVSRPGAQIDTVVNSTQVPPGALVGPARPAFFDRTGDIWAQGVAGGVEFRY